MPITAKSDFVRNAKPILDRTAAKLPLAASRMESSLGRIVRSIGYAVVPLPGWWMKSGNFSGTRMEKIGGLLPVRS